MSFNLDSKKGLASMEKAGLALEKTEEELKAVEKAMNIYTKRLQNEITGEASEIFGQIHRSIDDAKKILAERVDVNHDAFDAYNRAVKRGL